MNKEFSFTDLNKEMAKHSTYGDTMDKSTVSEIDHYIPTGNYNLNACLTGSLFGGFPNNRAVALAGPSGTGKTFLLMNAIKQAQDIGYSIVFYDSENAVDKDLVEKFGIDPTKFRYEPCNTVQEFRSSVTALTDTLIEQKKKGAKLPRIMLCLDSAGNLATQKEVDDAKSGSDKADMTRAKLLKSTFRILMTKLGICKIPFIFTNHTYQCVWGDANVIMHDDSIKNIKDIIVGDYVKTLDGSKEVELLTEFKKSYVLEFELENGTIFRCTPEHRFLIKPDWSSESSWKTAEDLNEEDIILQY
jgi:RecA/RadA recombinase